MENLKGNAIMIILFLVAAIAVYGILKLLSIVINVGFYFGMIVLITVVFRVLYTRFRSR